MIRFLSKTTWRLVVKDKWFGFINVGGLTLALASSLLIFLWVQQERGIDGFHHHHDRLYTTYQTLTTGNQVEGSYRSPMRFDAQQNTRAFMLEEAKEAISEIQSVAFYATGYELPWGHPETLEANGKKNKVKGSRASEDFFKLLNYPLLEGDIETALKDTRNIAISRKVAEEYFGSVNEAMHQRFRYEDRQDFIVSAVFENVPPNSSLLFDFLLSWQAHNTILEWASPDFNTYVLLDEKADPRETEEKINAFIQPHLNTEGATDTKIGLQLLTDRHLYGNFIDGHPNTGRITYVRNFSGGALFILLIACINFTMMSTARSVRRSKEIGIRKVLGTSRAWMAAQFYSETLIFSLTALVLAVALVAVTLPLFGQLTGTALSWPFSQPGFWIAAFLLVLITTLLAGSYPAFFLSSLQPVRAIKRQQPFSIKTGTLRQSLVVFQFGLSVIFLVATITIYRQTQYMQTLQPGYNRENLLYISIEGELAKQNNYNFFKQLASGLAGVKMVDRASETPHAMRFMVDIPDGVSNTASGEDAINWEGKQARVTTGFKPVSVGFDFVKLMGLETVEGRDFSRGTSTDSANAFLINEEAARQMNMKTPIGKRISAWDKKGHVIGVLKDYHTYSLHEPIKPLIVDVKEYEYFGVILVRVENGNIRQTMEDLEQIYTKINPKFPFDYHFVDAEYNSFYNNERMMAKLISVFTFLAIAISSLGILGLIVFSVEQRTKEMSIRKLLGASVSGITGLLSKDFVKLVFFAIVLASPIAWLIMSKWLESFAYRISLNWWVFAIAGLAAIVIALLTVSFQAIKAATANPVKSLRNE